MIDWLSAEALIVARLQAQVLGVSILTSADLSGVVEQQQVTPALHVIYAGDTPAPGKDMQADRAQGQITDQRWLLVVAVRNVKAIASGSAARQMAGPLIAQALAALRGWQPDGFNRPLRRGAGLPPKYSAGFAYFPFQFLLRVIE